VPAQRARPSSGGFSGSRASTAGRRSRPCPRARRAAPRGGAARPWASRRTGSARAARARRAKPRARCAGSARSWCRRHAAVAGRAAEGAAQALADARHAPAEVRRGHLGSAGAQRLGQRGAAREHVGAVAQEILGELAEIGVGTRRQGERHLAQLQRPRAARCQIELAHLPGTLALAQRRFVGAHARAQRIGIAGHFARERQQRLITRKPCRLRRHALPAAGPARRRACARVRDLARVASVLPEGRRSSVRLLLDLARVLSVRDVRQGYRWIDAHGYAIGTDRSGRALG